MTGAKNWSSLKVPELKAELTSRNLPTTGNKADLVARLSADDEKKAAEAAPAATTTTAATAPTSAEDEIDWEDDADASKAAPAPAAASEPAPEATPSAAPADSKPADAPADAPAPSSTEQAPATITEAEPEEPKQDFSAHLEPTSLDEEARKRAERAKRFGISDPEAPAGEETEEMKKARRAEKFGLDSGAIAKGLDSALPERPLRGSGSGSGTKRGAPTDDSAAGGASGAGRPNKRRSRYQKGFRGRGSRRHGDGGGNRVSKPSGGISGGGRNAGSGILRDPEEKAKAEARRKRFAGAA